MASRLDRASQQRLESQGLGLLSAQEAFQAMATALDRGLPQAMVAPIDWPAFFRQLPQGRTFPLLEDFEPYREPGREPRRRAEGGGEPTGDRPDLVRTLQPLSPPERQRVLTDYLRGQIARVLGMDQAAQIEPRQRLFDLGLDSLMAVELKNRLEQSLGQEIPTTLLFDYPTLESLVNYLLQEALVFPSEILPVNDPVHPDNEDEIDQFLAKIDRMSERDILQQLTRRRSQA
jgi:acyl carrier protein